MDPTLLDHAHRAIGFMPDDEGRYHVLMKWDGLAYSAHLPSGTLFRYTAEFGLEREINEPT